MVSLQNLKELGKPADVWEYFVKICKILEERLAKNTYKEIFGEEISIEATHAGLECADFKEHNPQLEMISIGPTILGAHSTDERLRISSVLKLWKFLVTFLEKLG